MDNTPIYLYANNGTTANLLLQINDMINIIKHLKSKCEQTTDINIKNKYIQRCKSLEIHKNILKNTYVYSKRNNNI